MSISMGGALRKKNKRFGKEKSESQENSMGLIETQSNNISNVRNRLRRY